MREDAPPPSKATDVAHRDPDGDPIASYSFADHTGGDTWLAAGRSTALRVPSAVSPHAFNVLLNPRLLAGTGIRIVAKSRHPFDTRLFKAVGAAPNMRGRARR